MARVKLTAGRVKDFKVSPEAKQSFLWDSDVPGLGVRATANAKVYVFQGRLLSGSTIRLKIGDCRTWAIDSTDSEIPGARQEARRLQAMLDQGIDPRDEKLKRLAELADKQAESTRQEVTVADAWVEYIDDRKGKWSARHLKDHQVLAQTGGQQAKRRKDKKIKPGPLSQLMGLKLSELTPERIEAWTKTESAKRPARTRLAFNLLRTFINWCDAQPNYKGLASPDACSPRIKNEHVPKQAPRDDCLQREQLGVWFKAVRDYKNPIISAYLQALLLTGARRNELANLRWDDVDFKWMSITIHDKVEGERTIPLPPYVAALLSPLPRINQWVFASPKAKSGRIEEPRRTHNLCLEKAGIGQLTVHGLRRSFGTLSEWVECPVGVVAQIMGHKPSAIAEKHYRKRPLDLLRMWHEKIEAWILGQAGIPQPVAGETGKLHVVK